MIWKIVYCVDETQLQRFEAIIQGEGYYVYIHVSQHYNYIVIQLHVFMYKDRRFKINFLDDKIVLNLVSGVLHFIRFEYCSCLGFKLRCLLIHEGKWQAKQAQGRVFSLLLKWHKWRDGSLLFVS